MVAFENYVDDVRYDRFFSYTKINHGFWERLIHVQELTGGTLETSSDVQAMDLDARTGSPCFLATGFVKELLELISGIPRLSGDFRFAASPYAWPACRRILGVPFSGLREVERIIGQHVPKGVHLENGIFWKAATIDGSIAQFYAALRKKHVVLVGPKYLAHFGMFAGFPDYQFIEIDEFAARCSRTELLERIVVCARRTDGKPTVYLFQGGPVATWLILKLHGRIKKSTLVDMGVALNLCSISTVSRQDWGRFYRGGIARSIEAIHPGWGRMKEAYINESEQIRRDRLWEEFSTGIDTTIAEVAGVPQRREYRPDFDFPALDGPVSFIESKKIDFKRIQEFLELSRKANHWTNFGPVTASLERALEYVMGVPAERAVVMCSSGTTALFAIVGLHALKQGRPLRVVTSAYGFFCSNIGPLSDTVTVVDCDKRALLDIRILGSLSRDSYDAVLVTNVFGMSSEFKAYRDFCNANDKVLLIDNATAPIGYERNFEGASDEIVSFHHTKPWGVGEGGCAVVAREDAEIVRGFLNFGVGLPSSVAIYATNGKISDFSAALILDRLERYPVWAAYYRAQYSRILRLAKAADLQEFLSSDTTQVHAHLPLLVGSPRDISALQNGPFPVRKYYRPLTDQNAPVAAALFGRMVNIPSHSGMAAVSTDIIAETLQKIQRGVALDGQKS